MSRPAISEDKRFWRHVDIRGPDECWPWTGGKTKGGYGTFSVAKDGSKPYGAGNATYTTAHRVAYRLTFGLELPDKGCHSCDNPPCCNPAHVFPGTQKENLADMIAKGRQPAVERTRHIGEDHGRCVISDAKVIELIARYNAGGVSQQNLASEYGIGQTQVSCIIRGESRQRG